MRQTQTTEALYTCGTFSSKHLCYCCIIWAIKICHQSFVNILVVIWLFQNSFHLHAFFPIILNFSYIYIPQGSVVMRLKCAGKLSANFPQSVQVIE